MPSPDELRQSFRTHPQAHLIISDLENLVGADWRYCYNGDKIEINGTALIPHEVMSFCDGVRYANKRAAKRLETLLCSI